jgi:hypothetical protein
VLEVMRVLLVGRAASGLRAGGPTTAPPLSAGLQTTRSLGPAEPTRPAATMSGVPKFWQRTDRVAVVVFEQAQRAGEPVSMGLVKRIIAELDEDASAA